MDEKHDRRLVADGATLSSNRRKRPLSHNSRERIKKKLEELKSKYPNGFMIKEYTHESFIANITSFLSLQGLPVKSYKEGYLRRRIRARMGRLRLESYKDYFDYLSRSPDEIEIFRKSLSINVTRFIRDRPLWEEIIKLLKESDPKSKLRVWSAGCAVGAEPYSLAMLIKKHLNQKAEIIATDVSQQFLQIAKSATYTEDYLAELKAEEIKEFFIKNSDGTYTVKPSIRRTVTFKQHDLTKDKYPENLDLILCRNVLIYIDRDAQDAIFNKFIDSLNEKGFLMIGSSESIMSSVRRRVNLVNSKCKIYRKKSENQ